MDFSDASSLLSTLRENNIMIYGTGYVATRFYQALKKHDLIKNVKCFVTSTGGEKDVEGLPVKCVNDIEQQGELMVCIAVHESIRDDIIRTLQSVNVTKYVWIYPFLNELMLGTPIRGRKIALKEIWEANRENYAMAARYLAIENYYGKNSHGYDIYMRSLSLYNSQATSEKRLGQFIELIKSWEEHGYDKEKKVLLLEDGQIIDGLHRITLAIYHRLDYIMCDVFPVPKDGVGVHGQAVALTMQSMIKAEFQEVIVKQLEEVNNRIKEGFGKKGI